jgi:sugar/nucleoside kinase (ribokinase family)
MAVARTIDVVGLGVSSLDFLQVVEEFPAGELVQRAQDSLIQGGGPVATAMVAMAKLGSRVAMVDKVGDDWCGRLILEEFIKRRVAVDWIRIDRHSTSSMASILVRRRDGARAITFSPGTAEELQPDELPEELIADARILHLNGRHLAASLKAARIARRHGVMVSFDGGAHRFREELRELVALSDICIVAREFAHSFTGTDDDEAAGKQLLDTGPEIAVITAGTEGSVVFTKGDLPFHQPAYLTNNPVDTTGAGDAYHGAFLHGILKGLKLSECAYLASAVAALNTRKLGGRSALPDLAEVERFLSGYSISANPLEGVKEETA